MLSSTTAAKIAIMSGVDSGRAQKKSSNPRIMGEECAGLRVPIRPGESDHMARASDHTPSVATGQKTPKGLQTEAQG
ncbi:hypothetical protein HAHE_29580 [Haloferula helveola]|uniref:Uncharacterized protein n=1 Tax=Haloferula helveola TaxID=490095 RepID=A0ABM7RBQ2_9BACT|nr:hypothetical protein HAHE_29580 [Haloferula helveola]